MNHRIACENLDIETSPNVLSLEELKRKYRLKALKYHPDKNKSPDAVAKFQEIQSSYEYLLKSHSFMMDDQDEDDDDPYMEKNAPKYVSILFSFLKNVLKEDNYTTLIYTVLGKVATACEATVLENLEKLDKHTLQKIYEIARTYREVLHVDLDFLEKVEAIVSAKKQNEKSIIMNPLIDDLLENNLYKMTVEGNTLVIPLWHHELVYDISGVDLYVKCSPILPDNIRLDEDNNVHISVEYNIDTIWGKEYVEVPLGKYTYPLELKLLKFTEEQTVIFVKQGISRINTKEMYDISRKSDVYVHVKLVL